MNDEPVGALLALWNDVAPELDDAYNDWHANEHVPERLSVPGMRWGRRYAAVDGTAGPRYLTLYGLRDAEVLESEAYRRLLSHPTATSARMRPHLRNLSRWVCDVRSLRGSLADAGLAVGTFDGQEEAMAWLQQEASASAGTLLAERLPDAAALPWLNTGQEHAIGGRWLVALALGDSVASAGRGARVYRALPVSAAWPSP